MAKKKQFYVTRDEVGMAIWEGIPTFESSLGLYIDTNNNNCKILFALIGVNATSILKIKNNTCVPIDVVSNKDGGFTVKMLKGK